MITGAVFFLIGGMLAMLVRTYEVALLGVAAAAVFMLRWSWVNGAHPNMAPLTPDEPTDPPLHSRTCDGPGLWGMVVTLMTNGTLYLSLLFGWFCLWTAAPEWSPPDGQALSLWLVIASGILLSLGTLLHHRIARRLAAGDATNLSSRLWQAAALGAAHVAVLIGVAIDAPCRRRR
jgi:cytochrome c oxidase subunit I+III